MPARSQACELCWSGRPTLTILGSVGLPERFLEQMGQQCTGSAMHSPVSSPCFPSNVPISEVPPQMSPVPCARKMATSKLGYHFLERLDKVSSDDGGILLNCSVYILLESKLFSIFTCIDSDLTKLRKTLILPFETQDPQILMHTSSWRAFLSCQMLSRDVSWYKNDPQRPAGCGTVVEFPGLPCDSFHCASGAGLKTNVL